MERHLRLKKLASFSVHSYNFFADCVLVVLPSFFKPFSAVISFLDIALAIAFIFRTFFDLFIGLPFVFLFQKKLMIKTGRVEKEGEIKQDAKG